MQPDGQSLGDPYRTREEVQRALNALCWALRHDHNQSFGRNLTALERCLRNMGYEIHRYDEMQYPNPALKPKDGVPAIERMADELAAARMEIADLQKIIEDLKKEERHA